MTNQHHTTINRVIPYSSLRKMSAFTRQILHPSSKLQKAKQFYLLDLTPWCGDTSIVLTVPPQIQNRLDDDNELRHGAEEQKPDAIYSIPPETIYRLVLTAHFQTELRSFSSFGDRRCRRSGMVFASFGSTADSSKLQMMLLLAKRDRDGTTYGCSSQQTDGSFHCQLKISILFAND